MKKFIIVLYVLFFSLFSFAQVGYEQHHKFKTSLSKGFIEEINLSFFYDSVFTYNYSKYTGNNFFSVEDKFKVEGNSIIFKDYTNITERNSGVHGGSLEYTVNLIAEDGFAYISIFDLKLIGSSYNKRTKIIDVPLLQNYPHKNGKEITGMNMDDYLSVTRYIKNFTNMIVTAYSNHFYKKSLERTEKTINKLNTDLFKANDKIEELLKEIDKYQSSPELISAKADSLFEAKNLDKLRDVYNILEKYHPDSKEIGYVKDKYLKLASILKDEQEERDKHTVMDRITVEFDDISGITWYKSDLTHHLNYTMTSLYIGKKAGNIWLRLKMSYSGDDWIFFNKAYLFYDGNTKNIIFNEYINKESEVSSYGSGVYEWIDVEVDSSLLPFLRKMVNGEVVKMRLTGKYAKTKRLSYDEVKAIKDVLMAYDILKKKK